MSRTELYIVKEDGELFIYKEFSNSHRGAALLWDNLIKKYLNSSYGKLMFSDKEMDKLWRLDRDLNIPRELRVLLISTFDKMLIKKENLPLFIEAINKTINKKHFEETGHFKDYPEAMNEILKMKDVVAIAWNQTSICSGVWNKYDKCPHCKHYTIERSYNIYKDKEHDFLFEYLNEIES